MSSLAAAAHDKLEISIRPLVKDDLAYIYDSMKKSYRELGCDGFIPKHVFWPEMHNRIESLRMNPSVEFRIATDPDDTNFVWGYAIVENKSIVHYVFVRASAQGQGVAKRLLADVPRPLITTHWTKIAEAVHRKHPGSLLYEPSRRSK